MMALDLITAERRRQIEAEGWGEGHDDLHTNGELSAAAFIYLNHGTALETILRSDGTPIGWPWERSWWKPQDRRRNLERAGALFLAEIDRRKRAGLPTQSTEHALSIAIAKLDELIAELN